MKKIASVLTAVLLFLSAGAATAQVQKQKQALPAKAAAGTWLKKALAAKSQVQAASIDGLPYMSDEYRLGGEPGTLSLNITGLNEISLGTWETPDGDDYDWGVWANARFTKKDGTVVWMDEMRPKVRQVHGGYYALNQDLNRRPLQIGSKTYEHGVLAHAPGLLTYELNGEYVRFDAEIGVAKTSSAGSVVFKVMASNGRAEAAALAAAVPEVNTILQPFLGAPVADWLTSPGTSLEHAALKRVAIQLNDPTYFIRQGVLLESEEPNVEKRIERYMELTKNASRVLSIQNQIDWLNTRAIGEAIADMKTMKGFDGAAADRKFAELKALASQGFDGIYANNEETIKNAEKALKLKYEILMANPALDMDKIVVGHYYLGNGARKAIAPDLGTQPNNWSNQYSARRSGFNAEILELSGLRSGDLEKRVIYKPAKDDAVTDIALHFDAEKMLFTSTDENKRWHVYEINTDGTGLHKLTGIIPEADIEFTDGCYLPDGRLIINTTLGYHGVPCVSGADAVGNLALFDPRTGYLRRLTFDQDNNWNPTVMNNGRVMYTRWEYTDLIHYFSRFVMHMNPDGTENKNLYGSGSYFPNSTFDMQPLPGGSSAFVGIISGHHGIARSGRLMIFDPAKSRKEEKGMLQEIPFRDRPIEPIIKDEMVNGVWPQFLKPHPLTDKYFLVTAKLTESSLWGIYLVDVFDNVTLIAETEGEGYINPIPLRKRPTPPVIPDRIDQNKKTATVFIQDIYEGEGLQGVPRGTVKKLRVLAYEYAYRETQSDHYAQGIQSGWDIKRLLGEVPVEEDGSVSFIIPANTPVALQPLDEKGRAVQWMRSWFVGQPGEIVSCVGCHEDLNQIAMPKRTIASANNKPHQIEAPEGGVRPFTFELEMQPILDRACVACHNENSNINLTGGRKDRIFGFSMSYLAFHPYFYRQGPEADMYVLTPYEFHASNSEMVQMLEKGHHGVELTDKEWRTLYNWIDFNCPNNSTFRANELKVGEHGYDQIQRRQELADKYANGSAVDWQQEIRDYAAYLEAQGPVAPVMPAQPQAKAPKEVKAKGWPFGAEQAKAMTEGKAPRTVELAPGITMTFVYIPAGEFVMGDKNGGVSSPQAKVKIAKGFWMSETEVTNEQMRALAPDHDNRLIGQFWKDHTGPNYLVNADSLSSIRVSWREATDYARMLGEKTGLNVTLPTEAQWEWAARAGSDTPFWWGNLNTNFAPYDNLADVQLTKMAVSGVNPQPMRHDSPYYPYWNYIPKDESVDDGHMLLTAPKQYAANPWGLYDMNGNVAEWTRSDYLPYPYNMKTDGVTGADTPKVARGGSWYDRTKGATSASRRYFLPWQRVWNVGFRLIIED